MRTRLLIPLMFLVTISGCSQPKSAPTAPGTTAPNAPIEDQGTSSGGGGFEDEKAKRLLEISKNTLADTILAANPKAFIGLPPEWTQDRLAQIIRAIHADPGKSTKRYGRELVFDHVMPTAQGEGYLIATSAFYKAYSGVLLNAMPVNEVEPYIREISILLLHETAHLLNIGKSEATNYKANVFAHYLLEEILEKNMIECEAPDGSYKYPYGTPARQASDELALKQLTENQNNSMLKPVPMLTLKANPFFTESPSPGFRWIVNRATGFGVRGPKDQVPLLGIKGGLWDIVSRGGVIDSRLLRRKFSTPALVSSNHETEMIYFASRTANAHNLLAIEGSGSTGITNCPQQSERLVLSADVEGKTNARIYYKACNGIGTEEGSLKLTCNEFVAHFEHLEEFQSEARFSSPILLRMLKYANP